MYCGGISGSSLKNNWPSFQTKHSGFMNWFESGNLMRGHNFCYANLSEISAPDMKIFLIV